MPSPVFAALAVVMLFAATDVSLAQTRVRTETVRRPAASPQRSIAPSDRPAVTGTVPVRKPLDPTALPQASSAPLPEILRDPSRLPPPVARMREKILAAARSGDLQQMRTVMRTNGTMPIFSLNDDRNPIAYWNANFPDSAGVEILSIVIAILEAGFIHVDQGTPQEMYLWPYFARFPLKTLAPPQRVELFRIVTGSDYKAMLDVGVYNFYRLGIGPNGSWRFLVAGD